MRDKLFISFIFFVSTFAIAGTKVLDYGFEDFDGINFPPDNYLFTTNYEEYWNRHLTGTEIVSNCSGRTAHSGNYYLHRNYYTGAVDPCLGTQAVSIDAAQNIGADGSYPSGGSNLRLASAITSNTLTIRFYFRVTDNWKNQSGMEKHKFVRVYGAGGSGDEASIFIHIACGNNTNTNFWIADMTGSSYSGIWGTTFQAGVDLQDGNWHSCVMRVARNNNNNQTGNITVTAWWDDWNMEGQGFSRTITCPDCGGSYSHILMQSNWSATYPSSSMGIDLDDIELWDGEPDKNIVELLPPNAFRIE